MQMTLITNYYWNEFRFYYLGRYTSDAESNPASDDNDNIKHVYMITYYNIHHLTGRICNSYM